MIEAEHDAPEPRILTPVSIPIGLLDLYELNPNVMPEVTFQDLVEDIQAEGFDEPVMVRPKDAPKYESIGHEAYLAESGRFEVVSGNHRTKAARLLNMKVLPAVVKPDLTDDDIAIAAVRRNIVRGQLDGVRMTDLVDKHFRGIDRELLAREMGFADPATLRKLLEIRVEPAPGDEDDGDQPRHTDPTDSLASMLASIMARHGDTVEQDYLAFVWKQRTHFLIVMDDVMKNVAGRLDARLRRTGENVNDLLLAAMSKMVEAEEPEPEDPDDEEDEDLIEGEGEDDGVEIVVGDDTDDEDDEDEDEEPEKPAGG